MPRERIPSSTPRGNGGFEELELRVDADAFELLLARENTYGQLVLMSVSTFVYMLFVVSIMPLMRLTWLGNALWVTVGLAVLVTIGVSSQVRVKTSRVRVGPAGITIDQGTALDHESIDVAWAELAGIDLEPVDPKDGRKGMQLRIRPHTGEPVDAFGGVGLGELNNARRVMLDARAQHRTSPGES